MPGDLEQEKKGQGPQPQPEKAEQTPQQEQTPSPRAPQTEQDRHPGVTATQALLTGKGSPPPPRAVAEVLKCYPAEKAAITELLQRAPGLGNTYVQQVVGEYRQLTGPVELDRTYLQQVKLVEDAETQGPQDPALLCQTIRKLAEDPRTWRSGAATKIGILVVKHPADGVFDACMDFLETAYEGGARPGPDWALAMTMGRELRQHADARVRQRTRAFLLEQIAEADRKFNPVAHEEDLEAEARHARMEEDAAATGQAGYEAMSRPSTTPPVLGQTAFYHPPTHELLTTRPYTIRQLADYFLEGGFEAFAAPEAHGWLWFSDKSGVRAASFAEKVILPGERFTFARSRKVISVKPELGGAVTQQLEDDQFAARAAYGETLQLLQESRREYEEQEQARIFNVQALGATPERGVLVHTLQVQLPFFNKPQPLLAYDFLDSVLPHVEYGEDIQGDPRLVAAMQDERLTKQLPKLQGARLLSFELATAARLDQWVAAQQAADQGRVQHAVGTQIDQAQGSVTSLAAITDEQLALASAAQKMQILGHAQATGSAEAVKLLKKGLAAMSTADFRHFVKKWLDDGKMEAFSKLASDDEALMYLFSRQMVAAGYVSSLDFRDVYQFDKKTKQRGVVCGGLIWPGKRSLGNLIWYGGNSLETTIEGHSVTLQIGERGVLGNVAAEIEALHLDFQENTKKGRKNLVGGLTGGAVDFFAHSVVSTMEALDSPAKTAEGLVTALSNPGQVADALGKALKDRWQAILDAAAVGEVTGDYSRFYTLVGESSAAIGTTLAGVLQVAKLGQGVVGAVRKVDRRALALYLREVARGTVTDLKTRGLGLVRAGGSKAEQTAGLTRRLTSDAKHVEQLKTLGQSGNLARGVRLRTMSADLEQLGFLGARQLPEERIASLVRLIEEKGLEVARREHWARRTAELKFRPPKYKTGADLEGLGFEKARELPEGRVKELIELIEEEGLDAAREQHRLQRKLKAKGDGGPKGADPATGPKTKTARKGQLGDLPDKPWQDLTTEEMREQLVRMKLLQPAEKMDLPDGVVNHLRRVGGQRGPEAVRETFKALQDAGGVDFQQPLKLARLDDVAALRKELQRVGFDPHPLSQLSDDLVRELGLVAQNYGIQNAKLSLARLQAKGLKNLPEQEILGVTTVKEELALAQAKQSLRGDKLPDADRAVLEQHRAKQYLKKLSGKNLAYTEGQVQIKTKAGQTVELDAGNLKALSGKEKIAGTVDELPEQERLFHTFDADNHSRVHDTEVKLLEQVGKKLEPYRGQASFGGELKLFTERAPCASCVRVIQQFQNRYPGLKVTIQFGF